MVRCVFLKDYVLLKSIPRDVVADGYMSGFVTLYIYIYTYTYIYIYVRIAVDDGS